jgi:hypothetical protein
MNQVLEVQLEVLALQSCDIQHLGSDALLCIISFTGVFLLPGGIRAI